MVLVDHKQPRQTSSGVGVEEEEEEAEVGGHGRSSVYPPTPPALLPLSPPPLLSAGLALEVEVVVVVGG